MLRMRGGLVYSVLREIRPLTLLSVRVVEETVRDLPLSVGTRAVLEVLVGHGPATVPTLAGLLDVTRQAVQRLVDDLLEAELVSATTNPAHRRSVLIEPTHHGAATFRALHTAELGTLGNMLEGVPDDDLRTTARVLSHLRADVRQNLQALRENQ